MDLRVINRRVGSRDSQRAAHFVGFRSTTSPRRSTTGTRRPVTWKTIQERLDAGIPVEVKVE